VSLAEKLTIEKLNKCKNYKKAILNLNKDIEDIEKEIYNLRPINLETIKSSGKSNYKLEEAIQEKKDLETILTTNIVRLNRIEGTIRQLKDLETVRILIDLYINDITNISELELKHNLSRSSIYRKRDKGIKDLSEIMWGAI